MTFPRFRLFDSTGLVLVYEFDCVTDIDDNRDPHKSVEHEALRGIGSRVIPGSKSAWDMPIRFFLTAIGSTSIEKYENLSAQINSLKNTIVTFEKYILKVDITTGGLSNDYKVMRKESIVFPVNQTKKKRIEIQPVDLIFKVDAWA